MEKKQKRKPDTNQVQKYQKNKRELDRSKKRDQPIRGVLQVSRHSSTCREIILSEGMQCSAHREEFCVIHGEIWN